MSYCPDCANLMHELDDAKVRQGYSDASLTEATTTIAALRAEVAEQKELLDECEKVIQHPSGRGYVQLLAKLKNRKEGT